MRIVTVRRISQAFFLGWFLWFTSITAFGDGRWQARGWSFNLFLQLDPLPALMTTLATGTLYAGLAWALATVALTVLTGRAFCGWICPFGTLHQAVGWLGKPFRRAERARLNRPSRWQGAKVHVLAVLLAASSVDLATGTAGLAAHWPAGLRTGAGLLLLAGAGVALSRVVKPRRRAAAWALALAAGLALAGRVLPGDEVLASVNLVGWLSPLAFLTRGMDTVVLPLLDRTAGLFFSAPRHVDGGALLGILLAAALLANLVIPRFYCRFLCPTGALLGLLGRNALWRIARTTPTCSMCHACDADCEGACAPSGVIRTSECVLCMNCLPACADGVITFRTRPSEAGEHPMPDVSRRGVLLSLASGLAAAPVLRLAGNAGRVAPPALVRPPGALAEPEFLDRCIRCGQCMRICPTGVLQPAGVDTGLEALWTPVFNNRIGTSGCQPNCVACGFACPTGAIRPFPLDEKLGRGDFAQSGPLKMGCAFIDRGRCLPWAMGRPCIVCQENCPVSPKAIVLEAWVEALREGPFEVAAIEGTTVRLRGSPLRPGRLAGGDHLLAAAGSPGSGLAIRDNGTDFVTLAPGNEGSAPQPGTRVEFRVRLHRPYIDPDRCTGCGICEHECPVVGLRAVRITSENESRDPSRSMGRG